ncbi:uncharacterized protein METZ01_LOCUS489633 [marine metagenome]|uniref:Uncharacterized protein n=1 Tax=marine metagenome TaxID=408172 RepID=A0A383CXP2_9ZZZZ
MPPLRLTRPPHNQRVHKTDHFQTSFGTDLAHPWGFIRQADCPDIPKWLGFKGEEWSGRPDLNWRRPPWEDCGDRPPRQYCCSCSNNTLFAAARFHKSRDVGTNMAQSWGKPG